MSADLWSMVSAPVVIEAEVEVLLDWRAERDESFIYSLVCYRETERKREGEREGDRDREGERERGRERERGERERD